MEEELHGDQMGEAAGEYAGTGSSPSSACIQGRILTRLWWFPFTKEVEMETASSSGGFGESGKEEKGQEEMEGG